MGMFDFLKRPTKKEAEEFKAPHTGQPVSQESGEGVEWRSRRVGGGQWYRPPERPKYQETEPENKINYRFIGWKGESVEQIKQRVLGQFSSSGIHINMEKCLIDLPAKGVGEIGHIQLHDPNSQRPTKEVVLGDVGPHIPRDLRVMVVSENASSKSIDYLVFSQGGKLGSNSDNFEIDKARLAQEGVILEVSDALKNKIEKHYDGEISMGKKFLIVPGIGQLELHTHDRDVLMIKIMPEMIQGQETGFRVVAYSESKSGDSRCIDVLYIQRFGDKTNPDYEIEKFGY